MSEEYAIRSHKNGPLDTEYSFTETAAEEVSKAATNWHSNPWSLWSVERHQSQLAVLHEIYLTWIMSSVSLRLAHWYSFRDDGLSGNLSIMSYVYPLGSPGSDNRKLLLERLKSKLQMSNVTRKQPQVIIFIVTLPRAKACPLFYSFYSFSLRR